MREAFDATGLAYRRQFVGKCETVLWESTNFHGPDGWRIHGLTGTYIRVEAVTPDQLWNQISQVELTGLTENGMHGVILP